MSTTSQDRQSRHRARLAERGQQRLDVVVPKTDAALVRAIAAKLRSGGREADTLRTRTAPLVKTNMVETGQDMLAMFARARGLGDELVLERDRGSGRGVDIE